MKKQTGWNVALWVGQVALAGMFLMAGGAKLVMSTGDYAAMPNAAQNPVPFGLMKFIGVSEVLGGLGVILPAATRIKPVLTPLAAVGLLVIMVLASTLHATRAEWSHLGPTLVLGAIAAFVAWGRWKKVPIAPRG